MAANEITGATPDEVESLRESYIGTPMERAGVPFEEAYCLGTIQRQPEDYDGPQRVCKRRTAKDRDDYCVKHKHYAKLDPLAAMTHGVKARRENLVSDFSEDEQDAYDTIVNEWQEYYGIDDPASIETLESMAVEIVRETRADEVIERHGLTHFKTIYGPEGPQGREPEANWMLEQRRAIRSSIEKMKDNLGLTRKHRQKMEVEESRSETLDSVTAKLRDALEDGEYDPEI